MSSGSWKRLKSQKQGTPGIEPGTSRSAVECSTPELYPLRSFWYRTSFYSKFHAYISIFWDVLEGRLVRLHNEKGILLRNWSLGSNEINPIYKIGSKKVKRIILSALFRIRRNIFSSELNLKSLHFCLCRKICQKPAWHNQSEVPLTRYLIIRPNLGVHHIKLF